MAWSRSGAACGIAAAFLAGPGIRAQDPGDAFLARVRQRVEALLREDDVRLRRDVRAILDDVLGPDAAPAFLGVGVEALAPAERAALGLGGEEGARIRSVRPGSPAEQAGLRVGDLLLRVGRRPVASPDDLRAAVRAHRPGASVSLVLSREGQTLSLKARLAADGDGDRWRDDLRLFLEREERAARIDAGAFDPEAFLDGLFDAGASGPLADLLATLRAEPAGDMVIAFLRQELLSNAALLRQHVEPGTDGGWRLRPDSVDFLRSWLEEEIDLDRRKAQRQRERKAVASPPLPAPTPVRVGFFVRDLTAGERAAAALPPGAGFAVTRLVPAGPALRAGVRPGDIVARIAGRVATEALLRETLAAARPGDALVLSVLRRGAARPVNLTVTLGPPSPGP